LNDHPKSLNEISQLLECVPESLKDVLRFLEEEGVVRMNLNGTYEIK
jgi:predicted transcriptional regulator